MAYNYLQDMPRGGSMDSFLGGYDVGQKYRQNQIVKDDNKALADILRGDTNAITRLQSPDLIQKAQNHLRELEQRKALQGFYTPATKDQYQANVTQNPIAAIMDGGKKPSNLVQAQQPSFQESQAPTMLDMLQTGKIASGKPASYDVEGAGNYLLGQANFDQLGRLTDYQKAIAKDANDFYGGLTEGVDPKTGQSVLLAMTKKGAVPSGYAPKVKEKEAKAPVTWETKNNRIITQYGYDPKGNVIVLGRSSMDAPPAPEKPMNKYQGIKLEGELRDDYRKDSANFVEISRQGKIIEASLKDPSSAATLASATAFMKMLDPESVVRESELAMAMKTEGLLGRMGNYFNVIESGQVLTEKQKTDFARLIKQYQAAANQAQRNLNKKYSQIATDYKLDPKRVAVYDVEKDPYEVTKDTDPRRARYLMNHKKLVDSGDIEGANMLTEIYKKGAK